MKIKNANFCFSFMQVVIVSELICAYIVLFLSPKFVIMYVAPFFGSYFDICSNIFNHLVLV